MHPGPAIAVDSVPEALHAEPPLRALVEEAKATAALAPAPTTPDAPEPDEEGPLYVARRKIYPQRVTGTYRRIKWIVLLVTLGIYYGRRSTTSPGC